MLDPLVEAKLEGLGHRLQIKFDRQLKELQASIQQQQGEGRQQQQQQQQQAVTAAAAVAVRSTASAEATAATVETAAEAVAARLAAVEEQLQFQATSALEFSLLQRQVESSLWDFLDPLVEQVQRQQQKSKQQQQQLQQQQLQQQQLQEHVRWLEWQGQVAEEQPRQTADKLQRKKWAEQIESGCAQIQSDYLDNSISRLSSEIHRLKQSDALSPPFELAMRHVFEDVGRLKATFASRGTILAVPPDNTLLAQYGV